MMRTSRCCAARMRKRSARRAGCFGEGLIFPHRLGLTDEQITLYLASIDASRVREYAGLQRRERKRDLSRSIDHIASVISRGLIHNGPCLLGLAVAGAGNRHCLAEIFGGRSKSGFCLKMRWLPLLLWGELRISSASCPRRHPVRRVTDEESLR